MTLLGYTAIAQWLLPAIALTQQQILIILFILFIGVFIIMLAILAFILR